MTTDDDAFVRVPVTQEMRREGKNEFLTENVKDQSIEGKCERIFHAMIAAVPSPASTAEVVACGHGDRTTGYDHLRCNQCGAFKTDSDKSWGIARGKWFKDRAHAEFYRDNGRHPDASPSPSPDLGGWMPINTAPKGRKVIVYGEVPGMMHPQTSVARYWLKHTLPVAEGFEDEDWVDRNNDGDAFMPEDWYEETMGESEAVNLKPTHWMPLPSPPAPVAGEAG